jgi:hypothetical protein
VEYVRIPYQQRLYKEIGIEQIGEGAKVGRRRRTASSVQDEMD